MRRERFACQIFRKEDGQIRAIRIDALDPEGLPRHIEVNKLMADRIADAVHKIVREAGVGGRAWSASREFELGQHVGAQVELLLRSVKPLHRADRIERISEAVARMSREEAGYWHAKSSHRGGLRALRVLLAEA